ncbi:DUF992 domain-containing protein [Mesorhizobium soli]|uniref:DUF992 domain-containing protein n=2 Tax=Pseudaminobacter soli (ex Li et al. 2025) TaxID=1295366 RepID=A0A2P7SES6_9HYPH|nr:DUF992 domain-containing protein [Mesorhizobium soli]
MKSMKAPLIAAAMLAASVTASTFTTQAHANGFRVGTLTCAIGGGASFIIGSSKAVACTFQSIDSSFPLETYHGRIDKLGIDVGLTDYGKLVWCVIAPTWDAYLPGRLAGWYVGANAEATAGLGVGANLLVGGLWNTFALQPLSVQGQSGVNAAATAAKLELVSDIQ